MNLFLLDGKSENAAKYHCDKHCVKMILETCQMLYTAWWCNSSLETIEWSNSELIPYKKTHENHPTSIWIRSHHTNYEWTIEFGLNLCREYERRYNKIHKCKQHLDRLKNMGFPVIKTELRKVDKRKIATEGCPSNCEYFYCAIPDDVFSTCAVYDDNKLNAIETYRNYYKTKLFDMKWNKGKDEKPFWFDS